MKSVRASVTATLLFSLAAISPWTSPDHAQAQPGIRTPELVCRQGIGAAGRRYIEKILTARIRCQGRAIKGIINPKTNCLTGDGDDNFQAAVRRAELKLSHTLPARCAGVDLTLLEFPGDCSDANGNPFDTLDLEDCIVAKTNDILGELLEVYYPPIDDFFRGFKSVCLRGTPLHAFKMFRGDIRSRAACTIDKALRFIDEDVDCRNDIPAWGPGTGDEKVDNGIRKAYVQFLGGIPVECANFNISELRYQDVCPDETGGVFTVFDLKECIFDKSRPQTQRVMNLLFPTEPICGNLRLEAGEQCDDGTTNNSDTEPDACRTDCQNAACGDGTVDTGESCDDGNTIETDDCTSACTAGTCGDGIKQGSEQCDDGTTNNSDSKPDACRTNCKNPSCGDTVIDPSFGDEECDDGNKLSNDLCSSTCKIEFCGDGIKQTSEQCDGNASVCGNSKAVCSNGCKCQLPCPATGELTLFSNYGQECNTNADCPVGTCDKAISGRCKTVTELDSGWTGQSHDSDINNLVVTHGLLDCDATSAPCGLCEVAGLDPSGGNCRCASIGGQNNNQFVCDEAFQPDADDCRFCTGGGTKANAHCTQNSQCAETGNTCNTTTLKCSHTNRNCAVNADCNLAGTCNTTPNTCECYFGAPFPLSSGGTPACVVNRFHEDVTGTANVDLGSGAITANLRTQVFLGITTTSPCPVCGGKCAESPNTFCANDADCPTGTCTLDPVRDDGLRGGFCVGGRNDKTACDVNGINTTFPGVPGGSGGGGYSIDCFPDVGKNVSGAGLIIQLTQTTGTQELGFEVPCDLNSPINCPCRVCTSDSSVPCNTDADCSSQAGACTVSNVFACNNNTDCKNINTGTCTPIGRCKDATVVECDTNADCVSTDLGECAVSTCSSNGLGGPPQANDCTGRLCTDVGGGEGECTTGPDSTTCDGVVRPSGEGILACNSDEGCSPSSVGIDAGTCTLVKRRECFLDPIVAVGQANPTAPVGAAAFCIPPTASPAINSVAGLAGPGRVVNQSRSRTFCESDPTRQYVPGVGGCIDGAPGNVAIPPESARHW